MSTDLNNGLMRFIRHSPTPFHAVEEMVLSLKIDGFKPLDERQPWSLVPGGRYLITRNESSLIALILGDRPLTDGIRLVGAHTDSPCLRIKGLGAAQQNYRQLGVEVYGSPLLGTWFDRDLSLAGRVTWMQNGEQCSRCIDLQRPVAIIPSLAIHLDREANKGHAVNPQREMNALLTQGEGGGDLHTLLKRELLGLNELPNSPLGKDELQILDYELSLYDTQSPSLLGLEGEFIASARLDNLLSCYAGLQALLGSDGQEHCLLICSDHEEVGSCSACGADGPFLEQVLARLLPDVQERVRCIQSSLLISADNAHGLHPNYMEKHDTNYAPQLNGGPVIKINNNQRYASNSRTSAFFRGLCHTQGVPVQTFFTRSDMACGSTIGPLTAGRLGVATVDVGLATFAMHSIRELAGSRDLAGFIKVLSAFFNTEQLAF